jgi:DNA-binding transcriptional regulator GbsR (MarR family)
MECSLRSEDLDRFVETWGSMGMLWGINRTMARIHALLLANAHPLSLDEIAERLEISRGNASMSLKELRSWGVIRRVHRRGERKDYYVPESDAWAIVFRIATERKKREFDPALQALRRALESAPGADDEVHKRLAGIESLLATLDHILGRVLADQEISRAMLRFMSAQVDRE